VHDTILVRYGEIGLKGKNRLSFEGRLMTNIRDCLKRNSIAGRLRRWPGRIHVETTGLPPLSCVFGIVSYSPCITVKSDETSIKEGIVRLLDGRAFATFRISARSLDSSRSSQQMNVGFGSFVVERYGKKVSLKQQDIDVGIEVKGDEAYVFIDTFEGVGGLPLGSTGKAIALLDSRRSVLAAWLMMKRGLEILPFGKEDITSLDRYSYGTALHPPEPGTAAWTRAPAIVVGDNLGSIGLYDYGKLVLRPLVGFSDEEIEERLKRLIKQLALLDNK
jgi:adenylyl- and sulfurtransferase ThiI